MDSSHQFPRLGRFRFVSFPVFFLKREVHRHTLGQFKHLDVVLLGPQLKDALRLRIERSNCDNGFEGWEFVGDTQDGSESTGLKEDEGDVRMAKAGQIPRCQQTEADVLDTAYMYST